MEVEDVARIGLAPRRAAEQERHLAVGDGLLGEVVVEDHRVHAVVAEILAHRAAGVGGEILHRRGVGGGGGDDDRVFHRAVFLEGAHELRHRRALLADRDIDAVKLLLLVAGGVDRLLVDDGIDDHRRLAGLAVADDELALAAADRDQRVDRLEPGLHRLVHRLAGDDAWRLDIDAAGLGVGDRPLAVDRLAERIDHAAEQALAHRHIDDLAGARHRIALADQAVIAEDHRADIVGLEVERHALEPRARERDELTRHHVLQAEDARDAVAHAQHLAGLGDVDLLVEGGDLLFEDLRNLGGADIHQAAPFMA